MDWDDTTLGSKITLQRGFDITQKQQTPGTIPIISSSGIHSYHNIAKVKGPGVVTGRKGTLGKVFYSKVDFWPHDTTLWVKEFNGNDRKFIYYLLSVMGFENYDVGASNPTLNRNHIHKLRLKVPPVHIQKKVASILSAYDNLIDNNKRRIDILENMADEIYREWFVRLRFPGYEKVKYTKGIPKGWEIKSVSQVYRTSSGGTPSRKNPEFFKGEYNWVKTGELLDSYIFDTEERISAQAIENSSAKIFPENTVIMAMYGGMSDESKKSTLGKLGILTKPSTTNQACCGFFPKETYMSEFFTFYLLKSYRNEFINISFGAAQQNISQTVINNFKIMVPNKDLIISFSKTIGPFFQEIKTVIKVNRKLIKTRGLLLSRLLSGQLNVNELDIRFPKCMEDDYAELHQ